MKTKHQPLRRAFLALTVLAFLASVHSVRAQGGTWGNKAPMLAPQHNGVVAAINGNLYYSSEYWNPVAQAYDPSTDSWITRTHDPVTRGAAAGAAINGKLYVVCGFANMDGNFPINTVEIYDPLTDSWTAGASAPTARGAMACAAINGKLYVTGGYAYSAGINYTALEVYDPASNSWTTKAPMPTKRLGAMAAAINGKLYVAGGCDNSQYYSSGTGLILWPTVLEVYDPSTDTWDTSRAPMPTPRYTGAGVALNGKFHVIGGSGSSGVPLGTHEVYDPATGVWTTEAPLTTPVNFLGGADVINSRIYVAGGQDGHQNSSLLQVFTPTVSSPSPVVTVNSATVAQGSPAVLTATVSGSTATPFSYNWTGPSGTGPFANAASITVSAPGTYTVVVTDANGLTGAGSGTLTVTSPCEAELAAANAQIAQLQSQLTAANSAKQTLQGQVDSLTTQNSQLQSQVSSLTSQVDNLTGQNSQLQSQFTAANASVQNLTTQNSALSSQNTQLQTQVDTLTTQNAELRSQTTTLATQKAQLATDLAAANATIQSLSAEKAQVQTQVDLLTQQLQSLNGGLNGGVGSVTQTLQSLFSNTQFQIPGNTPLAQFQSLASAIQNLNPGQALALYKNLGGKPGNGR
jgi:predicted  nucleic acid-binding Zn-ribbon protein